MAMGADREPGDTSPRFQISDIGQHRVELRNSQLSEAQGGSSQSE